MTVRAARTRTIEGKSAVEVRRNTAEILIFSELACLGAALGGVSVMLVTRRLEVED